MTTNIAAEISNSKKNHFNNLDGKLGDPKLNQMAYWSHTNWRKVPIIPPLLINDHFKTNFNEKANHFNDFFCFANQCSLLNDSNKLTLKRASITTSLLSSVNIKGSDILNILKSLDVNKVQGYDDISVRMSKKSPKSILKQ